MKFDKHLAVPLFEGVEFIKPIQLLCMKELKGLKEIREAGEPTPDGIVSLSMGFYPPSHFGFSNALKGDNNV